MVCAAALGRRTRCIARAPATPLECLGDIGALRGRICYSGQTVLVYCQIVLLDSIQKGKGARFIFLKLKVQELLWEMGEFQGAKLFQTNSNAGYGHRAEKNLFFSFFSTGVIVVGIHAHACMVPV